MEKIINVELDSSIDRRELFGILDENIKKISEELSIDILPKDTEIVLKGENAEIGARVMSEFIGIISSGTPLDKQRVDYIISLAVRGISFNGEKIEKDVICYTHTGKPLKPKTIGQKAYGKAMKNSDLVFGIGPAGTGKTYLAVAMAINAYKNKEVEKILLARPAVEAGERLGFLPGDLQDKVDPYLRPLYDALYEILGRDTALRLKEKEVIEIVPLAYMRGRTLDNAFIILDEAQNTTREQMKMFLTRMGFGSKMVVTGDITQIDLPEEKKSGLLEATRVLKGIKGIEFCYFKEVDVVRHSMVKKIISAYNKYYDRSGKKNKIQKED